MKETYNIYDHLEELLKRPQMYVGIARLDYIYVYLAGYWVAMSEAGVRDVSEPSFDGFREFVRSKYNLPGTSLGWANMIQAVTIGMDREKLPYINYDQLSQEHQEEAVQIFRELVEEYCRS